MSTIWIRPYYASMVSTCNNMYSHSQYKFGARSVEDELKFAAIAAQGMCSKSTSIFYMLPFLLAEVTLVST